VVVQLLFPGCLVYVWGLLRSYLVVVRWMFGGLVFVLRLFAEGLAFV